jgi:hypothetical protein
LDPEAVANDIQLRLAADDPAALEMIWSEYASDLLGYLSALHCSRNDAEDTLQEVFVTIARKRAAVAGARLLKPCLFQLARNVALNRIKHNQRIRDRAEYMSDWLVPAGLIDSSGFLFVLVGGIALMMISFPGDEIWRALRDSATIVDQTVGQQMIL